MTNQELLRRLRDNLTELELAYQHEPCEERLQDVLNLQARIMELESLVHNGQ